MSARLSTVLPRACSGLIYAAVPRITPARVGEMVSVGECVGSPAWHIRDEAIWKIASSGEVGQVAAIGIADEALKQAIQFVDSWASVNPRRPAIAFNPSSSLNAPKSR